MIDFTFPPEVDEVRLKVRTFMDDVVAPAWDATDQDDRKAVVSTIVVAPPAGQGRLGALAARTCRRSGAAWASGRRRWPRVGRGGQGVDRARSC